jgi:hypothetical protein
MPTSLFVKGRRWHVVWRSHEDPAWQIEKAWGMCFHEDREIHLDETLMHLPEQLRAIWIHELLHACIPPDGKNRPRWLSDKREEELITLVARDLATALAQ